MTPSPPRPEHTAALEQLRAVCRANDQLEIAVLIGSRASGRSHAGSDWDVAIQWHRQSAPEQQFGLTEQLRDQIAQQLKIDSAQIDLVDMLTARLAMRAVIAEEGIPLKTDALAWHHFLTRSWAELEQRNGSDNMRLDLYQQETATIAALQGGLLDEAGQKLQAGQTRSALEQNGVLHALQILIENAIGKAKHLLKASDQTVPVSATMPFFCWRKPN